MNKTANRMNKFIEENNIHKSFLWNNLPAIFYDEKYIIFSPYAKKLVNLKQQELNKQTIKETLKQQGFFGNPKEKDDDDKLGIMLYLTSACNLKCIYCFDDKKCSDCPIRPKEENKVMTPEIAINYLDLILKNRKRISNNINKLKLTIHFFGGEPTLMMKTIKEVVKFIEQKKINVEFRISTNGVTTEENIQYLLNKKFLFDIACDGKPEIHDRQRPSKIGFKSSFFTERMIKQIVKNKGKVRTKVVVTKDSTKNMPETVEYLSKLGINHIRLEPVLLDGRAETNKLKGIDYDEFVEYFMQSIRKARELSKKYNRNIWISNRVTRDLFEPTKFSCKLIEGNWLIISPTGKISKCVRNIHSENKSPFVVGSIEKNNLKINKEKYTTLKNISVDKFDKCKNCFAKYICSGDCINENYESTGNLTIPKEKNCQLTRKLIYNLIIEMFNLSKTADEINHL